MENNQHITPAHYSSAEFEAAYTYTGADLGARWSAGKTSFRVWAPGAETVRVRLYRTGDPDALDMTRF